MAPRNLYCNYNGALCEDGRCKRGLCIAANEEKSVELGKRTQIQHALEALIEHRRYYVARELLKAKGILITQDRIEKLVKTERVMNEARRQVLAGLPSETLDMMSDNTD